MAPTLLTLRSDSSSSSHLDHLGRGVIATDDHERRKLYTLELWSFWKPISSVVTVLFVFVSSSTPRIAAHKAATSTLHLCLPVCDSVCSPFRTMSKVGLISIFPTALAVPSCPLLTAPDRYRHRQFIRPYCSLSVYRLYILGVLSQSSPLHSL